MERFELKDRTEINQLLNEDRSMMVVPFNRVAAADVELPAISIDMGEQAADKNSKSNGEKPWLSTLRSLISERDGAAHFRELANMIAQKQIDSDVGSDISGALIGGLCRKAGLGVLSEMLAACQV
jgi:hypothetical protein